MRPTSISPRAVLAQADTALAASQTQLQRASGTRASQAAQRHASTRRQPHGDRRRARRDPRAAARRSPTPATRAASRCSAAPTAAPPTSRRRRHDQLRRHRRARADPDRRRPDRAAGDDRPACSFAQRRSTDMFAVLGDSAAALQAGGDVDAAAAGRAATRLQRAREASPPRRPRSARARARIELDADRSIDTGDRRASDARTAIGGHRHHRRDHRAPEDDDRPAGDARRASPSSASLSLFDYLR